MAFTVLSRLLMTINIITTPIKLTREMAASNVRTIMVAVKCISVLSESEVTTGSSVMARGGERERDNLIQ